MALFQIIFGPQIAKGFCPANSDGTGSLGLELDAVISESPSYKATPTKYPVESGANITDHVQLEPIILDIDGIVTTTPATPFGSFRGLVSPNAAADAHDYMQRLLETREPFTFVGSFGVYDGMILTSYAPQRTYKSSDSLEFHATMQQIQIASTELVPVTDFKEVGQGAGAQGNRGNQPTAEAPIKLGSGSGSVLSQWFPDLWR